VPVAAEQHPSRPTQRGAGSCPAHPQTHRDRLGRPYSTYSRN